MFHNLKVLRSIAFAHKFGGNHSATLSPNRLSAHFLLRHSSTSAPTTTPTKCWQCGSSHSPTGGIQFQCTKCQSLLDVPGQVVRNAFKYADNWLLTHHSWPIRRIISTYLLSIESIESMPLNCNKDSARCKVFCIQINSVRSIPQFAVLSGRSGRKPNVFLHSSGQILSKICRPNGVRWWTKRTKYFNRRSNERNIYSICRT